MSQRDPVVLDHVGLFTGDMARAGGLLERLGFVLTPLTAQRNQTPEGARPAGAANRCAMLERGYVETLTAVLDTPLARRLEAAVARYEGLHLLAFSCPDAEAAAARLAAQGFAPDPPVALRRPVEGEAGETAEAAFTVIRTPPEKMPEGRVQFLSHHTPELVWRRRWMRHGNGVEGLEAALVVSADPDEAAERYSRFTGGRLGATPGGAREVALDRGALFFVASADADRVLPSEAARPEPWIAAMTLGSGDPARTGARFRAEGLAEPRPGLFALPAPMRGYVEIVASGAPSGFGD